MRAVELAGAIAAPRPPEPRLTDQCSAVHAAAMRKARSRWQGLTDRLYGDLVRRWRGGELDDSGFERACRWRGQVIVQPAFALVMALPATLDWIHRDLPLRAHLERLAIWLVLWVAFGLAVGVRVDQAVGIGTRDLILRRHRALVEQDAGAAPTPGAAGVDATLPYGRYPTATAFANRLLGLCLGGTVLFGLLAKVYPGVLIPALAFAALTLWTLVLRLDRRIYLEISPEGVRCRTWGKQCLPFALFKAAYSRENSLQEGVVLVPRVPAAVAPRLSWWGRHLLESGEYVPAHAGTLTLWTTRVGLDQNRVLSGLRRAIAESGD